MVDLIFHGTAPRKDQVILEVATVDTVLSYSQHGIDLILLCSKKCCTLMPGKLLVSFKTARSKIGIVPPFLHSGYRIGMLQQCLLLDKESYHLAYKNKESMSDFQMEQTPSTTPCTLTDSSRWIAMTWYIDKLT